MNFTYRLKEPKSDKNTLIYFRTYFAKEKREFIYSTGEKIKPDEWNFDNHQPNNLNGRTSIGVNHRTINRQLNRYGDYFYEVLNRYKNMNVELTIDLLRERFNEEFKKSKATNDFFKIYDLYLDARNKEVENGEIKYSTVKRYMVNKNHLLDFQKDSKIRLSLEVFTQDLYKRYLEYNIRVKKHSANTLNRDAGLLKAFLKWAYLQKHTYNNSYMTFDKPPKFVTDEIALSYEELLEVYQYDLSEEENELEEIRDLFVFGCATGMRFGNYSIVSGKDIYNEIITVNDVKYDNRILRVPLNAISREILIKYDYNLPIKSNQEFNKVIKRVFKIAGFTREVKRKTKVGKKIKIETLKFYQRISSHTARRTFITIMKNNRIPDKVIMDITGHRSIESFNMYYKPSEKDKVNYMNEVFK